MELKFVWVEDYKNIKKMGYNFNHSNDEEFQYINGEIIIKSKSFNFQRDFFSENIYGLTAIVGKNGAGKTNLTEFINFGLAHVVNGGLSRYTTLVGILILDNNIFVQRDLIITNEGYLRDKGYQVVKFKDVPLDDQYTGISWHEMERNKYIYYNPTLDLRGIPVSDNLINISTTMMLFESFKNYKKVLCTNSVTPEISQLEAFMKMENFMVCDFLLFFEEIEEYLKFIPNELEISIDSLSTNYLLDKYFTVSQLNEGDANKKSELQREINELSNSMFTYIDISNYYIRSKENSSIDYYSFPVEERKSYFKRLFFLNLFQAMLNQGVNFEYTFFRAFLNNNTEGFSIVENKLDSLNDLSILFDHLLDKVKWSVTDIPIPKKEYRNYDEMRKVFHEHICKIIASLKDEKKIIKEIIINIETTLKGDNILSLGLLSQFSSGQNHLISFYSRLFWARKQIKVGENDQFGVKGESIVLFVDEGEVALHPEWQRTFLQDLFKFIKKIFNDYNVQLIISTHSPFVLSDIPKENLIFLDKKENGESLITNYGKTNTFGANIHDLLADSFFMKDGFIGEFAKGKIAITLNWLKTKANELNESTKRKNFGYEIDPEVPVLKFESTEEEHIYHRRIIELIGEPLVKNKLMNMFIEFVNDDSISLKLELEKAKARVLEIEKRLADD